MLFSSSFCFLAFFWHHGIFEYQQAVHGSFLVLWLSAFRCLVLGFSWSWSIYRLSFFFFFAGDKYLRHSALDSNCIYSFDLYFLPALQGPLGDCWKYIYSV